MKLRKVIFYSVIIFCAYCSHKLASVYRTREENVWNYSIKEAVYFAVYIQFLRVIAPISINWIADTCILSKMMILSCAILILKYSIVGFEFFN